MSVRSKETPIILCSPECGARLDRSCAWPTSQTGCVRARGRSPDAKTYIYCYLATRAAQMSLAGSKTIYILLSGAARWGILLAILPLQNCAMVLEFALDAHNLAPGRCVPSKIAAPATGSFAPMLQLFAELQLAKQNSSPNVTDRLSASACTSTVCVCLYTARSRNL